MAKILLVLPIALALPVVSARGETLAEAWAIALQINDNLQAQQSESVAQGYNAAAARSARLPTVRTFNVDVGLSNTPGFKFNTAALGGGTVGGTAAAPAVGTVPILGADQTNLPFSLTYGTVPLYTGGRIRRSIDAADARVGAQRSDEFRTALDLKLTVAEAYIGVLRAHRNLETAQSNVRQLESFARDILNRRREGLAIRSDELAAEVSLANARLGAIRSRTGLESAQATYNRYLGRPQEVAVSLDELTTLPADVNWQEVARQAIAASAGGLNEAEVRAMTDAALRGRPELTGLAEQARALGAQADATRAGVLPQVAFTGGLFWVGNNKQAPQGIGFAGVVADWTITDGGASRRRATAYRQQELATLRRRADAAADIALQVRTRWLDLQTARQSIPVARAALAQAEENVNVVNDRYRQQLSNYTEVLDAELRRVQAQSSFYNATYDENLALFRLRRAVGDL
ncbi:MAG: TolC family protein [Isosphaeraceae bacterium]|nr:TolC family protein [Isosphaeraceae bacterium]